jgi:hypothetical protein
LGLGLADAVPVVEEAEVVELERASPRPEAAGAEAEELGEVPNMAGEPEKGETSVVLAIVNDSTNRQLVVEIRSEKDQG